MPLELMRNEMQKVMSGESIGVTRYYGAQCPHKDGDQVLLAFRPGPGIEPEIVVKATVVSVRPFRVKDRREDHAEAQKEGWATAYEWWGHFERIYSRIWADGDIVHRLQLKVEARVEKAEDSGDALPMLGSR
jgi:hypothetical protein